MFAVPPSSSPRCARQSRRARDASVSAVSPGAWFSRAPPLDARGALGLPRDHIVVVRRFLDVLARERDRVRELLVGRVLGEAHPLRELVVVPPLLALLEAALLPSSQVDGPERDFCGRPLGVRVPHQAPQRVDVAPREGAHLLLREELLRVVDLHVAVVADAALVLRNLRRLGRGAAELDAPLPGLVLRRDGRARFQLVALAAALASARGVDAARHVHDLLERGAVYYGRRRGLVRRPRRRRPHLHRDVRTVAEPDEPELVPAVDDVVRGELGDAAVLRLLEEAHEGPRGGVERLVERRRAALAVGPQALPRHVYALLAVGAVDEGRAVGAVLRELRVVGARRHDDGRGLDAPRALGPLVGVPVIIAVDVGLNPDDVRLRGQRPAELREAALAQELEAAVGPAHAADEALGVAVAHESEPHEALLDHLRLLGGARPLLALDLASFGSEEPAAVLVVLDERVGDRRRAALAVRRVVEAEHGPGRSHHLRVRARGVGAVTHCYWLPRSRWGHQLTAATAEPPGAAVPFPAVAAMAARRDPAAGCRRAAQEPAY